MQPFSLTLRLQLAGIILQAGRAVIYSLGDMNSATGSQVFGTFKAQHWTFVHSGCVLADGGSQGNSSTEHSQEEERRGSRVLTLLQKLWGKADGKVL